jgi:hypothetical protein
LQGRALKEQHHWWIDRQFELGNSQRERRVSSIPLCNYHTLQFPYPILPIPTMHFNVPRTSSLLPILLITLVDLPRRLPRALLGTRRRPRPDPTDKIIARITVRDGLLVVRPPALRS